MARGKLYVQRESGRRVGIPMPDIYSDAEIEAEAARIGAKLQAKWGEPVTVTFEPASEGAQPANAGTLTISLGNLGSSNTSGEG